MDPIGGAMALPAAALACAERLPKQRALTIEALAVSGQAVQGNRMGLAGEIVAAQADADKAAAQAEPAMRQTDAGVGVPADGRIANDCCVQDPSCSSWVSTCVSWLVSEERQRHSQIDPAHVLQGPLGLPATGDPRETARVRASEFPAGLSADARPLLVVRAAAANAWIFRTARYSARVARTRYRSYMLKG